MFVWNLDFSVHCVETSHQYWFSIVNEDYTPRPAYLALKEMIRWAHSRVYFPLMLKEYDGLGRQSLGLQTQRARS